MISIGIAFLAVAMAACVVAAVASADRPRTLAVAAVVAAMLTVQYLLAANGILRHWERRPPPFMILLVLTLLLTIGFAFSPIGTRIVSSLPMAVLVGSQVFRLPLELVMHQAAEQGVMPVQMSYSGYNFDILSGASAAIVSWLLWTRRGGRVLVIVWNALGFVLLIVIVGIAIASLPVFAAFGQDRLNTWIADAPFVWLPGVLVQVALLGHLLVWRKLGGGRV